jgi:hypothetical protein
MRAHVRVHSSSPHIDDFIECKCFQSAPPQLCTAWRNLKEFLVSREVRCLLFASNARRESMILSVLFASAYFKRSILILSALMRVQL